MSAALRSQTMSESRGQVARRRRMALRVSRDIVAAEARVSVKTVKSYEDDAHAKPLSGQAIEDALDRLEAGAGVPARAGRRASDTPQRRVIDAALESAEGAELQVRVMENGVTAILLVPRGATATDEQIQQVIRDVRGE